MNHVALMIDSRSENVPLVGRCVKEMAGNFFSNTKLSEIEQAVVELVNNCIEHAYDGLEDQQIIIRCTLSDDYILIEVIDYGEKFDTTYFDSLNTHFDYDPLDIDNLPEGGFGLKIIKTYMDEVNYRREDCKNHWSLTKYRSFISKKQ